MNKLKLAKLKVGVLIAQDLRKLVRPFRKRAKGKQSQTIDFIGDIAHFYPEIGKHKRALVTLPPWAWQEALAEAPHIRNFNFTGLLYEMVRALNHNGFIVDIVGLNVHDFKFKHAYDILVGHGGGCEPLIRQMRPGSRVLQYVSGAYWKGFIQESNERYERYKKRNGIRAALAHKRRMDNLVKGEEFLTQQAHYLFSCFAPRMVKTFGASRHKFFYTGLAAYVSEDFVMALEQRDFEAGKQNFIYVGGTSGNIQKGADLIIEAFARVPKANLYIYCELEDEILNHYQKELSLPNIHYIYHYRYQTKRLKKLLTKINYSIHAPINTGIGTAFAGSMGAGLIPVGYIDIPSNTSWNILSESYAIDTLVECIEEGIRKDTNWCRSAATAVVSYFDENWSVRSFSNKFDALIQKVNNEL